MSRTGREQRGWCGSGWPRRVSTRSASPRRSGVSDATIRSLTRGEKRAYRPERLARLSEALDWPPNTIERLSRGEDVPKVVDYLNRATLVEKVKFVRRALDDLEDAIRRPPS